MHRPVPFRAAGVSFESLESRLALSAGAGGVEAAAPALLITAIEQPGPGTLPTPTGLNARLVAPRAVVLEWTDVAGETGYVIERRTDGTTEPWATVGDTAADVTRFTQDGLAAGKTYLYRVRARNAGAASEPSNVGVVTVAGESAVPAAPRLEASLVMLDSAYSARLQWSNVANEQGYKIERRVDGTTVAFQQIGTTAADAFSYSDDALDAGKTYLYRVRAFNAAGNSAYSNTAAVTVPGVGAPAAPRELVAELVQGRFVRLRWVDVAGEKGYKIERRFDGSGSGEWVQVGTTAENVITFADERVESDRTYVYRVRAFNDAGNSPYSNTAAVTVPDGPAVPAAPRELNAELTDAGRVKLTWNDVAGEKGYKVERRVDGTSDWAQIGTTGENVTSFVDERVDTGIAYIYRVRAFNEAGHSSYSNTDAVRIPGEGTAPLAPRLEVDLVAPRAARLNWTNVAGETGYRIERRVDGSTEAFREIRTVGADVTNVTDDGLEPGKTYLYRVRAFNAALNSPYSNTGVVRVLQEGLPTAPRELRATVASPTRVELRWVDSAGETGYRIERRLDGTTDWSKIGNAPANATTFADTGVTTGKAYIYRVRAFNDVGNSPYSNTAAAVVRGEGTTPAAPRLEAGLVAPRAARLNWTNVAGETGYRVERRVDGSPDEWRLVRTVGPDVTTVSDDGLDLGKTYLYRVRAFNAAGNSPFSNVAAVRTIGEITRPAAPRDPRAIAVSPTQIDLRWIGVDGEIGYRIERRLDGANAWEKASFVAADVTTFSDRSRLPGRTYIYRVRAVASSDVSSEWSNNAVAKTPDAPVTTAAGLFSANRITPLAL